MSVNQLESNLEAITQTIAYLEKQDPTDEKLLKELKKERNRLLKDINLI